MAQNKRQRGVHEGFPNPATDGTAVPMDLNKLVVQNPTSTFYMRVASDAYEDINIFKGDIVVIDRSLAVKPGDLVVAVSESEFILQPVPRKADAELEVWGAITYVVHKKR